MGIHINIFCQKEDPLHVSEIIDFIEEGVFFDTDPSFSVQPVSGDKDDALWTELIIEYEADKRPVILHRESRSERLTEDIEEAIEELQGRGLDKKHATLVTHLKNTKQLFIFELGLEPTEDCWEMVDNLQSWIAREFMGLIYVPAEGFYNAGLNRICKL